MIVKGWRTMSNSPPPAQQPQQPRWGYQPAPGQAQWGQPPPGYQPYPPAPRKRRKWPWITLGALVLIVGGCVAVIAGVSNGVSHEINKTENVFYQVTGDAQTVTVTYSTWNNGSISSSQQDVPLPWTKREQSTGLLKGGTLSVTVGADGGSATCSVSKDDGPPRTAKASGAFSTATCDVS